MSSLWEQCKTTMKQKHMRLSASNSIERNIVDTRNCSNNALADNKINTQT